MSILIKGGIMRKLTSEELKTIVENHGHWLRHDCEGWKNMRAILSDCDLRGSDLRGSDLSWSDLRGSNLSEAKDAPFYPFACPDTGEFVAWKKVNGYIVKLQIPEDAKRCSATTNKCRCDKALVLAIQNADGTDSGKTSLTNANYSETVYTVGEMVYPDSWDDNRWNECSHGIHFFVNRQEAVNW